LAALGFGLRDSHLLGLLGSTSPSPLSPVTVGMG
jgi:hypothetical protein